MWIFRNLTVHDSISGVLIDAIEEQLAEGHEGLREEDKWLMEVDLDDLTCPISGDKEVYWLLAVRAARERFWLQSNCRREWSRLNTRDG